MEREFDFIVYGATGFTAKWVIVHLLKENVKFAISGRNNSKLEETVKWIRDETKNSKIDSVPMLVASVDDIDQVTARTRILLNCAGPYILTGEAIVKSCVENSTHYLDITGEPFFIEKCNRRFFKDAEEKGIYIVNACGFDSVPADIGVEYFKQQLGPQFEPLWCESILQFNNVVINHTTLESAILGLSNKSSLSELRQPTSSTQPTRINNYRLKVKKIPFFSDITNSWVGLFMGSDASIVRRSQKLLAEKDLEAPIKYGAYFEIGSLLNVVLLAFFGLIFYVMIQFEKGKQFIIKNVDTVTFGKFRALGPTREEMDKASFSVTFYGAGKSDNETKNIKTKISGPDPGYIATPICLVSCGMTLLEEIKKPMSEKQIKFPGGVLTTATAFYSTNIIENLSQRGIKFETLTQ